MTSDRKPSIAELNRQVVFANDRSPEFAARREITRDEVIAAVPVLLEIAATALAYENARCDSPHCDHPAHRGECAILKAGRRMSDALAKVRP